MSRRPFRHHVFSGKFLKWRAQAALFLVLLIGGITILISIGLGFFAISFVNSGFGFQVAQRASAVASAGADDALLRLDRNKDFSSPGYNLSVASDTARVVVTQSTPVEGQATITSAATISNVSRKVEIIVSIVTSTGQISVSSRKFLTL